MEGSYQVANFSGSSGVEEDNWSTAVQGVFICAVAYILTGL